MKSKSDFHFKEFSIAHAQSTMKVGTDAVLLGAWVHVAHAKHILEIGTGNGTIALMLAQRSGEESIIDAVEINEADASQALQNFKQSPWPHKIYMYHNSIQKFYPDKFYDIIVCNPPYFNNSQKPANEKRLQARHTTSLSYEELITSAVRLIHDEGRLNVILPYVEGLQFISLAKIYNLFCTRQFSFKTRDEKPIERWLLEFSKKPDPVKTGTILLYKEKDEWSDSYKALTADFYLKL